MSGEFSGKVVIVSGASSGIGQATAIMFAGRGAKVTLCGRDQERLEEVHDQCVQASGGHADRFLTVQGDLTEAKIRANVVEKTVQSFGRLDILVPNAGITLANNDIRNATEKVFDATFDINLKSVFFLIQAALPHLENSKGNIVSTSSCASTISSGLFAIYAMCKAALDHMTRCLAIDLGPKGIRVNAVNPSFVDTRITRDQTDDPVNLNKRVMEFYKATQPLQENVTADDVAQAICFLASDCAKFITGECLLVDGGKALTGAGSSV